MQRNIMCILMTDVIPIIHSYFLNITIIYFKEISIIKMKHKFVEIDSFEIQDVKIYTLKFYKSNHNILFVFSLCSSAIFVEYKHTIR